MGIALIKIKIMPESPDTNLDDIEKKSRVIIEDYEGKNLKFEKEPIAFGLIAVIATFSRDETLDTDEMLKKLQELETVNSAEIMDFRRALG